MSHCPLPSSNTCRSDRIARFYLECLVKGAVGRQDPQSAIENKKRMPNRFDDLVGVSLLGAELAFRSFQAGHVRERHDGPVDPVVQRSVGQDSDRIPLAVAALYFLFHRREALEDLARIGGQVNAREVLGDVPDGPAHVRLDEIQQVPSPAA